MKKSGIFILLAITLIFTAFVAGFYIGRNYNHASVQIGDTPTQHMAPAATTMPQGSTGSNLSTPGTTISQGPININTATLQELDTLPGIGPKIAQAIIDYRTEYGPFTAPEDLLYVGGIGEKKLEAILDYITVGG